MRGRGERGLLGAEWEAGVIVGGALGCCLLRALIGKCPRSFAVAPYTYHAA